MSLIQPNMLMITLAFVLMLTNNICGLSYLCVYDCASVSEKV